MEKDLEELLEDEDEDENLFSFSYEEASLKTLPFLYDDHGKITLCKKKNFLSKCVKKTEKFVKKHKKAIIITVAVVTTVVVVGVVAGPAIASAVAGSGAATAGCIDENKNDNERVLSEKEEAFTSHSPTPEEKSKVSEVHLIEVEEIFEDNLDDFKEMVVEDRLLEIDDSFDSQESSIVDTTRELGSAFAHKVFDEVSEYASIIPKLEEEVKDVYSHFDPQDYEEDIGPMERYEDLVSRGHEVIDSIFSTEIAPSYSTEAKEAKETLRKELIGEEAIGIIPFFGRTSATQTNLAAKGWKVGQPINNATKFGYPPKWNTVRKRYWKNQATLNSKEYIEKYGKENLKRMKKGLAPKVLNKRTGKMESIELHHIPPQREGGLFDVIEVSPDEHAFIDPNRHIGK